MKPWIKKVLGITDLLEEIKTIKGVTLSIASSVKDLHVKSTSILKLLSALDESQELHTKSVQHSIESLQKRIDLLEDLLKEKEKSDRVEESENEIEQHALEEEIEVTDGMHIPITKGMKVRFETEGVETDINIE